MRKEYKYFLILLLCFFFVISASHAETNPSHYQIKAKFNPTEQFLAIEGHLKLFIRENNTTNLSFRIQDQFIVDYFTVENNNKYSIDTTGGTFTPNSMALNFELDQPAQKGDLININFKYSGRITNWSKWSVNVMNPG